MHMRDCLWAAERREGADPCIIPSQKTDVDQASLPLRRILAILSQMQIVYTPDEVADLLGLDREMVTKMAEMGRLSGLYLDGEWRISDEALRADLRRIEAARSGSKWLPLATLPDDNKPFDTELESNSEASHEVHDDHESFHVSIEIENDTTFSGDFHVRLVAEGDNDTWKNFDGEECELRDAEVTIHKRLAPGESTSLFDGILRAHLGDRLFINVPEQPGVELAAEKVYVLDTDTEIRLRLTRRGLFGKRSTLQFQQL